MNWKVRQVSVDYEDTPAAVINIKYDLAGVVTKLPGIQGGK